MLPATWPLGSSCWPSPLGASCVAPADSQVAACRQEDLTGLTCSGPAGHSCCVLGGTDPISSDDLSKPENDAFSVCDGDGTHVPPPSPLVELRESTQRESRGAGVLLGRSQFRWAPEALREHLLDWRKSLPEQPDRDLSVYHFIIKSKRVSRNHLRRSQYYSDEM